MRQPQLGCENVDVTDILLARSGQANVQTTVTRRSRASRNRVTCQTHRRCVPPCFLRDPELVAAIERRGYRQAP